jgi:hypothetical protein
MHACMHTFSHAIFHPVGSTQVRHDGPPPGPCVF